MSGYLWRVEYIKRYDYGGDQPQVEKKSELFLSPIMNLDDILYLLTRGNNPNYNIEITHAEYLGRCFLVAHHEEPG